MKGLFPLFLGLFGTFAFSWVGLTVIPNFQIGHLDPESDEEGTDVYPRPQSGMVERGRHVYAANGCIYCHSRQLRPDYAASDIDRTRDFGPQPRPKWGERRSAPRDYIFDRPVLLGKMRMGPDLADIGKAAPAEPENPPAVSASPAASPGTSPAVSPSGSPNPTSSPAGPTPSPKPASAASTSPAPAAASPAASPATPPAQTAIAAASPATNPAESRPGEPAPYSTAWQHRHLYSPRGVNIDSDMPAYRFLYEKHLIDGERSADALELTGSEAPPAGWEVVPTYDARCLVAYLMSLDQSHPLKEVKSAAATSSPAASPPAGKGTK